MSYSHLEVGNVTPKTTNPTPQPKTSNTVSENKGNLAPSSDLSKQTSEKFEGYKVHSLDLFKLSHDRDNVLYSCSSSHPGSWASGAINSHDPEYSGHGSEFFFYYDDIDDDGKFDKYYQIDFDKDGYYQRVLFDDDLDGYADSVTEIGNIDDDGFPYFMYYTDDDADGKIDTVSFDPPEYLETVKNVRDSYLKDWKLFDIRKY